MNSLVPPSNSRLVSVKRIGRLLSLILAVVASLLTFPSGMVAMAACWFAAYTLAALCGKRAAWFLAAWAAIVIVKRVDWPWGLWCVMCVVVMIVAARMVGRANKRPSTTLGSLFRWSGWIAFAVSSYQATHLSHSSNATQDRPIVCLGDSLTSYTPRFSTDRLFRFLNALGCDVRIAVSPPHAKRPGKVQVLAG